MGVLEVGHVAVGAGIQSVDYHFAVHWPGNLYAPVLQIHRYGSNLPVSLADSPGFGKKAWQLASVKGVLTELALVKQLKTNGVELTLQFGEKLERFPGEDLGLLRGRRAEQFHTVGRFNYFHSESPSAAFEPWCLEFP